MNLKSFCTCLSGLALIGQCIGPISTCAAQSAASGGSNPRGGQAPSGAAGGSGNFSVVVAPKLTEATANSLKSELVKEDFVAAETRTSGEGTFDVVIGGLASRDAANAVMEKLRSGGYTPSGIVDGTTPAAGGGESVFRVQVAEFGSAAEAEGASEVLADEGFVNVDVVQENGRHMLMLGTFNRKADANALLTQVNEAGFALASVVNRDRLRGPNTANPASADLSSLSQSEQTQTRQVLEMAEKVESGEASAAEVQQLRETIQNLPENQKAIVSRQETSRSADREKMQQIFTLYRDFERAMADRNYDFAEKALADVRQLDSNDIYLASRVKALEIAKSGGTPIVTSAAAPSSTSVDPAQVQQLLNEARASETAGNNDEALQKYRQVLALDTTNGEARSKVAALGEARQPAASSESADGVAALMQNKPVLYGAGAFIALILILIWMKSRGRKVNVKNLPSTAGLSSSGPDFIDPLAADGGYNATSNSTPAGITSQPVNMTSPPAGGPAMAGAAGMAGFTLMDDSEDEEEELAKPAPVPAPSPPVEDNDMVSIGAFDISPESSAEPASTIAPSDEVVSINFDEEPVLPTAAPVLDNTPAKVTSSMDADLEALLRGSFSDASQESESVPESLEPAVSAAGAIAASGSTEQIVFQQSFDEETEGSSPSDWRGEYDYSTLSVANLAEAGHAKCLMYEKMEGVGSATYHLSFPPAKGRVTLELDVRCDDKNKFLLGIYLEKDEDFKQSVHTIVHQLDPNGPASLRVQGEAVPYQMETWRHLKYEIDLVEGLLDAWVDDDQVVKGSKLPVAPEYFNTLSIRDNLATTGTLYLDNIRISEA